MKQLLIRVAILIFSFCFGQQSYAQVNRLTGIEVTGVAETSVVPNEFIWSFIVKEQQPSLEKAKRNVDAKTTMIVEEIKSQGILSEAIQSAQVSIYPIYREVKVDISSLEIPEQQQQPRIHVSPKQASQPKIVGYDVSRRVQVTLTSIDDYDQLLARLINMGITQMSPLQMNTKDVEGYYQQALSQAIQQAKNKALMLANNLGVTLGKVEYLQEQSSPSMRFSSQNRLMQAESNYHSSNTGYETISARVLIRFSIDHN
jgi:hypothetical protein